MSNQRNRYKIVASADGRRTVQQSSVMYNNGMGGGNTVIGGMIGTPGVYYGMLQGILVEDESILQQVYEDIYQYDVSCGTTVDLRSTLASSGFTLSNIDDKHLDVFQSSINRLGFPTIVPQVYLDMYVRGKFISTLLYNRPKKEFSDQIIHSAKDCRIIDNPLYSGKPVIKFRPPESMIEFFTDDSEHAKSTRERLNPEMVRLLSNSGQVDLDDLLTVYVPRPTISGCARGVSMYRRVVPIYVLEKLLYRGTISEAQRRQRAITHIQAGSDNWQPVDVELQTIVAMFQQADLDPVGAILATRNDVQVNDVRPGGDFWKWTDVSDTTTQLKLRAMGVSEAFLSGESTYSGMEVSLSVFLENLRSDRDYVTQSLFDNHLLPLIAHVNDLVKDPRKTATGNSYGTRPQSMKSKGKLTGNTAFDITDASKYLVPKINWEKSLRPEADTEYLQTLDTLVEKGIPIGASMYAAAGGISIDEILSHQAKEVDLMKRIQDYKKELEKIGGGGAVDGEGDMGDDFTMSSLRANRMHQIASKLMDAQGQLRSQPKNLLNRGMEEDTSEIYQGKRHHVPSARAVESRTKKKDMAKKVIRNLSTDDEAWNRSKRMARAFTTK